MRAFIGIDLPEPVKHAIDEELKSHWPNITTLKPVPACNYHMTLAFLGTIERLQIDSLKQQLALITAPQFSVSLDALSFWTKPPIAMLIPNSPPATLLGLQSAVLDGVRNVGIATDDHTRRYKPHVTLARRFKQQDLPCVSIEFTWQVKSFHLFESLSTPEGVRYPLRESWALG